MEEELAFIPTRGSALKKNIDAMFKAVTFESYKPKPKKSTIEAVKIASNNPQNEFNVKKARHEVIKFGTSGFDPQKKEQAKIQLLIKLGAKPPKNKYQNYKILQAEKRKAIEKQASRLQFQQLGKNSVGKSNSKGKSYDRKRRKEKSDILDIYGKVKGAVKSADQ